MLIMCKLGKRTVSNIEICNADKVIFICGKTPQCWYKYIMLKYYSQQINMICHILSCTLNTVFNLTKHITNIYIRQLKYRAIAYISSRHNSTFVWPSHSGDELWFWK